MTVAVASPSALLTEHLLLCFERQNFTTDGVFAAIAALTATAADNDSVISRLADRDVVVVVVRAALWAGVDDDGAARVVVIVMFDDFGVGHYFLDHGGCDWRGWLLDHDGCGRGRCWDGDDFLGFDLFVDGGASVVVVAFTQFDDFVNVLSSESFHNDDCIAIFLKRIS